MIASVMQVLFLNLKVHLCIQVKDTIRETSFKFVETYYMYVRHSKWKHIFILHVPSDMT